MSRAAVAALAFIALGAAACYRDIDARALLGSQGYVPKKVLLFQHWSRKVTVNDPFEYKPLEYSAAAANDSGRRVYIGSRQGELSCFSVRRGKLVWQMKIGRAIRSRIVYKDGTLYFGAGDGYLYAVDAEEHKVRWKYAVKGEVLSAPVIIGDRVYFTSTDHRVTAVDLDSGEWKWHYSRSVGQSFSIRGQSAPLVHKGSVYVGFADGYLVSLKADDGALQWEKKLSQKQRFADVDTTPLLAGDVILAGSFQEGLYALELEDGLIRWRLPARGASTPALSGDTGYITTARSEVVAFSIKTGKVLWRAQVPVSYLSDPVVFRRYVLFSQSRTDTLQTRGGVWVLDRKTGGVESVVDVGHGVRGQPLTAGLHLFFLSDGGWFHSYRFGRGWR